MKTKRNAVWSGKEQLLLALAALVISALTLLWVIQNTSSADMRFDTERVFTVDSPWQASVNGGAWEYVTPPVKVEAEAGDVVRFKTVLSRQNGTCNSLMFHSSHQEVKVYVDGVEILSYGEGQKAAIPMSPGSPWQYSRLPSDWVGKPLMIELVSYYDSTAGLLGEVMLGTKAALLYNVVKTAAPIMFLMIPSILISTMMLLVSVCFKEPESARKMRNLGAFTATAGLWIVLEGRVLQLFYGDILVAMNLVFVLFALMPVFAVCYFRSYAVFQQSAYMRGLLVLSVANVALIHGLRICGVLDYMSTVTWVQCLLVLTMLGVLGKFVELKWKRKKLDWEDRLLFTATLVFSLLALADIIRFYRPHTEIAAKYSCVGLFCFVLMLGYAAVRREAQAQNARIEQGVFQKLAYNDILTGLRNRRAFEEHMEHYRSQPDSRPIIMMSDMNGLKWINDNLGHAAGDHALIQTAKLMEKHFGDLCDCYRIGGDEFCVMTDRCTDQAFARLVTEYRQELSCRSGEAAELSISCGWTRRGDESVDDTLKRADAQMYCEKALYKAARRSCEPDRNGAG